MDQRKASANRAKHNVLFEKAATVFCDALGLIVAHPRHSNGDERFVLLSISEKQRLLAVMYVERATALRIVSARRATRKERRDYEESQ